jgi:hypothetical protein
MTSCRWFACLVLGLAAAFAGCRGEKPCSPPEPGEAAAPQAINVTTAQEFVDAIGPDRVIHVMADINLSDATDRHHPHVRWDPKFDGLSLTIRDVGNLTIVGFGEMTQRKLLVRPRYAFVLNFENCRNVELQHLSLGHTPEGTCDSGVIGASQTTDLRIVACDLFGCGTEALTLSDVRGVKVTDSTLRDCTYGIATLRACHDVLFQRTSMRGNREYHGLVILDCSHVRFEDCTIEDNQSGDPLFDVVSSDPVRFIGGAIRGNTAPALVRRRHTLAVARAQVIDNHFQSPTALEP